MRINFSQLEQENSPTKTEDIRIDNNLINLWKKKDTNQPKKQL